jgi:hypothetical protein
VLCFGGVFDLLLPNRVLGYIEMVEITSLYKDTVPDCCEQWNQDI